MAVVIIKEIQVQLIQNNKLMIFSNHIKVVRWSEMKHFDHSNVRYFLYWLFINLCIGCIGFSVACTSFWISQTASYKDYRTFNGIKTSFSTWNVSWLSADMTGSYAWYTLNVRYNILAIILLVFFSCSHELHFLDLLSKKIIKAVEVLV